MCQQVIVSCASDSVAIQNVLALVAVVVVVVVVVIVVFATAIVIIIIIGRWNDLISKHTTTPLHANFHRGCVGDMAKGNADSWPVEENGR